MPQHRGEGHTRRLPSDLAVIDVVNVIELRVAVSLGKGAAGVGDGKGSGVVYSASSSSTNNIR